MQDRHRKDAAGRVNGVEHKLLQATHGARAHVRAGRGGDAVAHAEAGLPVPLRTPPSPPCLCLQHPCPDGSPEMQHTLLTCKCASAQAILEGIGDVPAASRLIVGSWSPRTAAGRHRRQVCILGSHVSTKAGRSELLCIGQAPLMPKFGRIVSNAHRLAQALAFRHDTSAAAPLNPTPTSRPCTILLRRRCAAGRCEGECLDTVGIWSMFVCSLGLDKRPVVLTEVWNNAGRCRRSSRCQPASYS